MTEEMSSAELRKEIGRLQDQLEQSAAELQDFLHIVSHDFRGPLRAIMSSSMILIEDFGSSLPSDAQLELKRQSDAAKKLSLLLEELLKLSRLNRRAIETRDINLGSLLLQLASDRGVAASSIHVSGDMQVHADLELSELLLSCLLDNSLKFGYGERPLAIWLTREGQGFQFKDNGIGIDPARASRAFLPFERFNGDEYPGLGMGLATAKRIVTRHGGSIAADGLPGEGTTIKFVFGS
jgi:signal transduction histidine kinase